MSKKKKSESDESAQYILDNCDLLIREDCLIVDNVLYEKINEEDYKYRVFFNTQDYDYVKSNVIERKLKKRLNEFFE